MANKLLIHSFLACVQTSPISFVARDKGNKRRLHAGKFIPRVFTFCRLPLLFFQSI